MRIPLTIAAASLAGVLAFAQGQPPADGIMITSVIDNYDFVVVALTAGAMEVQLAGKTETKPYAAGDAFFIERNTPHAVANPGKTRFALLGVTIK